MLDENTLIEAKGVNGQLQLMEDRIRIHRKGIRSFIARGTKGGKDIPIPDISSVQFKKAVFPLNGHIRFVCAGEKGGVRSIHVPWDENTVVFNWYQQGSFQDIKQAVETKLRN